MYEKQTWAKGDKITSDKLHHMEDGIEAADGNSPLVITISQNLIAGDTGDKTAQEVYTALQNNTTIVFVWENDKYYATGTQLFEGREASDPIYLQIYAISLPRNGSMQRPCVSYQVTSDSNLEPVNPTAAVDFSVITFEGIQPEV